MKSRFACVSLRNYTAFRFNLCLVHCPSLGRVQRLLIKGRENGRCWVRAVTGNSDVFTQEASLKIAQLLLLCAAGHRDWGWQYYGCRAHLLVGWGYLFQRCHGLELLESLCAVEWLQCCQGRIKIQNRYLGWGQVRVLRHLGRVWWCQSILLWAHILTFWCSWILRHWPNGFFWVLTQNFPLLLC